MPKKTSSPSSKYQRTERKATVTVDGKKVSKTVYIRVKDKCACVRAGLTPSGKVRYVPVNKAK